MSFAHTIAAELRIQITAVSKLAPSHRNPETFHIRKSDIAARLGTLADMLEGNFDVVGPEIPAPKKAAPRGPRKPYTIEDRRGNVVHVDFKNRRRVAAPAKA